MAESHTSTSVTTSTQETEGTKAKEKDKRVEFQGRLGYDPRVRVRQRDNVKIATFHIAEHLDDGSTTWHKVRAFRSLADQIHGSLFKADLVIVRGYEKWLPSQRNPEKRERVIYAAVIKLR